MVSYGKKNSTNGYRKLWIDNKLTSFDLAAGGLCRQVCVHKKTPACRLGLVRYGSKVELAYTRSLQSHEVTSGLLHGSPSWTRTKDPLINSQML